MMEELDAITSTSLHNLEDKLSNLDFSEKMLDLCFILDTTGSMGSYITAATQNIELICDEIINSERLASPECLRIGLIAYRDHPPQDRSYITLKFDFTSNPKIVQEHLKSLWASGGGDGPEAVTAAMHEALTLDWRPQASRMAVLITDAPPHGIGEYGDGFSKGDPSGHDPLKLARTMAQNGISLFVVACEPAFSGYMYSNDFFRAITNITSAMMLPLTTANLLPHVIVGSAFEQMDMERLVREVGHAVAERVVGGQESVDEVARELHEKLLLRNESTKQLFVEDIYRDTPEARHNVEVWLSAPDIQTAKPLLKKIIGSRFTEKYLQSRYTAAFSSTSSSSTRVYPIPLPSRKKATNPMKNHSMRRPSTTSTSSASRQVISDFKVFSSSTPRSFSDGSSPPRFGNPSGSGSGSQGKSIESFGGSPLRDSRSWNQTQGSDEDDEAEEEEEENDEDHRNVNVEPSTSNSNSDQSQPQQGIDVRQGSISFDQARRITTSAAWRTIRT
ncbi:uncharacterized protein MELLADRAFT_77518 [Melampsora larici-populina 98AG31]|uniref:VWFA domain-containing protein n=1 Tax=Melampsora larici-populina (strain 98AG31 / pathotype 3-4-7) TaxID=747676 RepID=F4RIN9_MELLP|nr:uncharacterized protein MELLADRAFT_77518 [Melampsora larici-populina 98AG31]EGG07598.1 hypothetical protein MELLADRAFT_77518 [Melampsora larici-populina 98AG31]